MILKFELTMPNVGSWNNKWTGEDRLYARVLNYSRKFGSSKSAKEKLDLILATKNYRYDFGDGWCASIKVEVIDCKESKKVVKKSRGFMGYDWMIDSILFENKILTDAQRKQNNVYQ